MQFWLQIILSAVGVIFILSATVLGFILDRLQPKHWKRRKQRYLWPCYVCSILLVTVCIWSRYSRIQIRLALGEYHSVSASVLKGMVTASYCKERIPGAIESDFNTFPVEALDRVSEYASSVDLLVAFVNQQNVSLCEYTGYSDPDSFYHHLDMPLLLLLFPILLYPALTGFVGVFLFLHARRNDLDGACQSCGYNLTGNVSGVCPECGTPAQTEAE